MKAVALPLTLMFALGAFVAPAMAQEDALDAVTCLRLTSEAPLESVEPVDLSQILLDGTVEVEVLDSEACAPAELEPKGPMVKGTSYVKFAAFGAGAAVELAALAQRHEGADTINQIDAAAKAIAAWAKKQRKWLDSHPPQACYKAEHRQWRTGVIQVRTAAKSIREALRTLKPAPMRKAVRQLSAGADNLTAVDLGEVREACVEAG